MVFGRIGKAPRPQALAPPARFMQPLSGKKHYCANVVEGNRPGW
jgi:hypothetical protein